MIQSKAQLLSVVNEYISTLKDHTMNSLSAQEAVQKELGNKLGQVSPEAHIEVRKELYERYAKIAEDKYNEFEILINKLQSEVANKLGISVEQLQAGQYEGT